MEPMKHHLFSLKNLSQLFLFLGLLLVFSGCIKATPEGVDTGGSTILSECSLNVATSSTCKLSTTGTIPTTTFGSNITSYTNATATTSITAAIPNGFYSSKSVTFTDAFLTPANIKSGITIFGVTGTGAGFPSNAFRTTGTLQLTSAGEASTYAGIALPVTGGYTYRDVPRISTDDDGTSGGSVTYVNRTLWGVSICGGTGTIEQRITNCSGTFGANATWSGVTNGNSGQGIWKLVTRTGDCTTSAPNSACSEVWRDESTQMLWSSKVSESINWCRSSGNNFIAGNPAVENDPSDFCDNNTHQAIVGQAVSACHDDNSVNFVNTHASITNTPGKGGLSKGSTPAVAWRLPSKGDYEQANANGLRFVMPDTGANITGATSTYEWTSSVQSTTRANAWMFDSLLGYFTTNARNNFTNVGVRCIGR